MSIVVKPFPIIVNDKIGDGKSFHDLSRVL